jgi:hypothetical protein
MSPASVGFLHGLLFHPEDRGDMFLRNVGLSPNYNPEEGTLHSDRRENLTIKSFMYFLIWFTGSQRSAGATRTAKDKNIKIYNSIILALVLCGCETWLLPIRE